MSHRTPSGVSIALANWSALTRSPLKAELYERETYFREGLSAAEEVLGAGLTEQLWRSSILMMKPDGLAAGKLTAVHDYLTEHDFSVVGVHWLMFDRMLWRELWRFQLTSATLDRLAVNDCVLLGASALLLILRSGADHDLPATVRLSSLKGSATLSAQAPGTLRSLLGQPNRVFSYLHVADEPADLLRELGLLVEPAPRRRLLRALAAGRLSDPDRAVLAEALRRDAVESRSLSGAEAVKRVLHAVDNVPTTDSDTAAQADRVRGYLCRMRDGERIEWRAFVRELDRLGLPIDRWDLAILGTSFIVYDDPGATKMLTNPDPETWRRPVDRGGRH